MVPPSWAGGIEVVGLISEELAGNPGDGVELCHRGRSLRDCLPAADLPTPTSVRLLHLGLIVQSLHSDPAQLLLKITQSKALFSLSDSPKRAHSHTLTETPNSTNTLS